MSQQAGWYANPDDPSQIRWWDGQQWTDQVQAAPAPDAPPAQAGAEPTSVNTAATYQPRGGTPAWVWVVVSVIAVAVIAGIVLLVLFLLNSDDEPTEPDSGFPGQETTAPPPPAPDADPMPDQPDVNVSGFITVTDPFVGVTYGVPENWEDTSDLVGAGEGESSPIEVVTIIGGWSSDTIMVPDFTLVMHTLAMQPTPLETFTDNAIRGFEGSISQEVEVHNRTSWTTDSGLQVSSLELHAELEGSIVVTHWRNIGGGSDTVTLSCYAYDEEAAQCHYLDDIAQTVVLP